MKSFIQIIFFIILFFNLLSCNTYQRRAKNIIQTFCEMPDEQLARNTYIAVGIAHAAGLQARLSRLLPEAHVEIVNNYKKYSSMDEDARVKAIEDKIGQLGQ